MRPGPRIPSSIINFIPTRDYACISHFFSSGLCILPSSLRKSGARKCLGTWKWLRQWTTPSSGHACEIDQISSVRRMTRWRLSFQLFIHFMGFNTPGKILYMYYVLTNLHLLSLYQNTPSRWCFQGKGQVCFYLRQQVYILQKSSPKFKSGVSVKLQSSHKFQEPK